MKTMTLLGTAAAATILASAAMADSHTAPAETAATPMTTEAATPMARTGMDGTPPFSMTMGMADDYLASDLIGMRLYVTETEMDPMLAVPANSATEWDDVGEIGDLVIGADGSLQAVVLDIGGFLGLGERHVAVDWSALRAVREDDDPNEIFWTVNATEEALQNAPEYKAAE